MYHFSTTLKNAVFEALHNMKNMLLLMYAYYYVAKHFPRFKFAANFQVCLQFTVKEITFDAIMLIMFSAYHVAKVICLYLQFKIFIPFIQWNSVI